MARPRWDCTDADRRASRGVDNPIERAIELFAPHVGHSERRALYALRCSLLHDYSLANRHTDPDLCHLFVLTPETGAGLVALPTTKWDGTYPPSGAPKDLATTVSLYALGELAESVHRAILSLHAGDSMALALPDAEVEVRYTASAYL